MGKSSRTVLLHHPDPLRRQGLAKALEGWTVLEAGSWEEVVRGMAEAIPALIISPAQTAKRLVREADRTVPWAVRIFFCEKQDAHGAEELITVAAEGHLFHTVEEQEDLGLELQARVERLLRGRSLLRRPVAENIHVSFSIDGTVHTAPLEDVSNSGLAFRIPIDALSSSYLPGRLVEQVEVFRDQQVIFRATTATVRHASLVETDSNPYFRVGLRLSAPPQSMDHERIVGRVAIQALLRRAVGQARSFTLRSRESAPLRALTSSEVHWLETAETPQLACQFEEKVPFRPGDIVELSFDFRGQGYQGLLTVAHVQASEMVVTLPLQMQRQHQRNFLRFRCHAERSFSLSFRSPLNDQTCSHPVLDLHCFGVSFQFDGRSEVLPPGLQIQQAILISPEGEQFECTAEVRATESLSTRTDAQELEQPYRCGLKLLSLPPLARSAILDAFIRESYPDIRDGHNVSFDTIWELIQGTRAWYGDYPLSRGPHMDVLRETYDKLTAGQDELGKTFVYLSDDKLVGHAAGLRYYDRTWVVHHLAALPGFHRNEQVTRELTCLAVDYVETLEDIDFVRYLWHTENKWTARFGTWIARAMAASGLSRLRFFNHLRFENAATRPPVPEGLPEVKEASAQHLSALERHYKRQGDLIGLQSDDLAAGESGLQRVGERYARHGLLRSRQVFVVESARGVQAFALVERSSSGLHWGEFLNAFSLLIPQRTAEGADKARQALIHHCMKLYADAGRPSVVALVADEDVEALKEVGFQHRGRFGELTFHRSLVRLLSLLMTAIFDRVRRREKSKNPLESAA